VYQRLCPSADLVRAITRKPMLRLKLIQSASLNGRHLSSGCEIQLDATTAHEWITEGKAELVDVADVWPLFDAPSANQPRPQPAKC
jgi:hypothetical protein